MVVSQNGGTPKWFIMETRINMNALEVHLFQETSI